MPVNMGLTFLIGGLLGWMVVKILKPPPYLEGLIVATCSAGNATNYLDPPCPAVPVNVIIIVHVLCYIYLCFVLMEKLNFA